MAIVDELVTLLTLENDSGNEAQVNRLKSGLTTVTRAAGIAAAAFAALGAATVKWASTVAESVDEAGKFADSIGIAYEELQELEFAGQRSGASIEGLRSGLEGLIQGFAEGAAGEFGKKLDEMGIAARTATGEARPLTDILGDIAEEMEGLTRLEAQALGRKLGINQELILLLQNGRDGISDLRNEARRLGAVIPEDAKIAAANFNDALLNVQVSLTGITNAVAVRLLPTLTRGIQAFENFIVANRELIAVGLEQFVTGVVQGLELVITTIGTVVDAIGSLVPEFLTLGEGMDATSAIATAVAVAFGVLAAALIPLAVKAAIAVAPFLAIGAAIAGLILIIDDFVAFMQGRTSVIGSVLDGFQQQFPETFAAIAGAIGAGSEIVGTAWNGLVDTVSAASDLIIGAIQGLPDAVGNVLSLFADAFPNTTTAVSNFVNQIGGLFSDFGGVVASVFDLAAGVITSYVDALSSFASSAGDRINTVVEFFQGFADRFPGITSAITGVLDTLAAVFDTVLGAIFDGASLYLSGLSELFSFITDVISDFTGTSSVIESWGDIVSAVFGALADLIGTVVVGAFETLEGFLTSDSFATFANATASVFADVVDTITELSDLIVEVFMETIPAALRFLSDVFSDVFGGISGFLSDAASQVSSFASSVGRFLGLTGDDAPAAGGTLPNATDEPGILDSIGNFFSPTSATSADQGFTQDNAPGEASAEVADRINQAFMSINDGQQELIRTIARNAEDQQQAAVSGGQTVAAGSGAEVTNTFNNTQTVNGGPVTINVRSTDPSAAAREAKSRFDRSQQTASPGLNAAVVG